MLGIVIVLVTVPILVLPAVRSLNRRTQRLAPEPRWWTRAAGYVMLGSAEAYLFGLMHMSYWGTPRDTCIARYENWDGMHGHARYWPLERKCTEFIDMVPSYVNPLIVILLAGALACALVAAAQALRHRRQPVERDLNP
ncbi:hypothetical protein ACFOOK_30830 [Micromonospora krabiensis]|uniref:Uncharacterized protein n=1 Tax=Micromonospora krabiensis TaxID=307121 RepID=A0A1C3N359_9ACTN|nr:hypothetical protein [Micromonospora krabiensis]SBV27023.1 hypothetical protein GA0070620_2523 [Micromonospora krabiensis]